MNIYEKETYTKAKAATFIAHHSVMMKERKQMDITGVKKLLSFDSELFTLDTLMGILQVRGMDLELKNLDLEKGELTIIGYITAFEYDDFQMHDEDSKGIFGKLFR
ncbi:MAG TPA: sporulation protein YabP [Firmicutes bacterium]|nr:sporulation protein YabP [Bacillota bacterium]